MTATIRARIVVIALVVASCSAAPSGSQVVLENATDVPVMIYVDGSWVGTYAAGAIREVPVSGSPPHQLAVYTGSGARLVDWGFDADQAIGGATTRADLPCGVVRVSVGRIELPALTSSTSEPGLCP